MIKTARTNPEKFLANIDGTSFLEKKMKCEYITSKEVNTDNFYYINNCSMMLMGENLSICGSPDSDDIETILSFCQFLGVYGLETDLPELEDVNRRVMRLMEYGGNDCEDCTGIITNENVYGFSEFCCSNFMGSAFSTVYAYLAKKVSRGISDIYYLTENRKIVSGAVATRYDGDEIYITFVSTARTHRRKGLAAAVVKHIISANPGRKVILMCEEELVPFYSKLGFYHKDNVYLYTLREEKI